MSEQHTRLKQQGWEFPKDGGYYIAIHEGRGVKLADDFEYIGTAVSAAAKAQDELEAANGSPPEVKASAVTNPEAPAQREEQEAGVVARDRNETAARGTDSLFADAPLALLRQQMHPASITTHPSTLMRAGGIDEDLRKVLREGGQFRDDVDIYFDGTTHWLADGNHRHAAALREGKLLDVNVHKGGLDEAILHAVRSNVWHGLKRSNDDKRLAVVTLLTKTKWSQLSDTTLAEMADVKQPFVGKIQGWLERLVRLINGQRAALGDEEATRVASDEYAEQTGAPEGLVKIVRLIPQDRFEQLGHNVIARATSRQSADGKAFAVNREPKPEAPKLFEEVETTGITSGGHRGDQKVVTHVEVIPEVGAEIKVCENAADGGREQAAEIQQEWDDRLITIRREVAGIDSPEELSERLQSVRAAMRQYDRDGYDLDDMSDFRARELKVHMDAIVARELQLREKAKPAPVVETAVDDESLPFPPSFRAAIGACGSVGELDATLPLLNLDTDEKIARYQDSDSIHALINVRRDSLFHAEKAKASPTGDPWVDNEVRITITLLAGQHPKTKFRHAYVDVEVGEGGRVANRRSAVGEHQVEFTGHVADLVKEVREQLKVDATADRYTQRCETCRTLVTVGGEDKKGRNHTGPNCPKHPDHVKKDKHTRAAATLIETTEHKQRRRWKNIERIKARIEAEDSPGKRNKRHLKSLRADLENLSTLYTVTWSELSDATSPQTASDLRNRIEGLEPSEAPAPKKRARAKRPAANLPEVLAANAEETHV